PRYGRKNFVSWKRCCSHPRSRSTRKIWRHGFRRGRTWRAHSNGCARTTPTAAATRGASTGKGRSAPPPTRRGRLARDGTDRRNRGRAAMETLAIIAYHQPVTRSEIEELRGVSTSAGSVDVLLETGWIRPRGRRKTPGRPVTYGTTSEFLSHFGLDQVGDLP